MRYGGRCGPEVPSSMPKTTVPAEALRLFLQSPGE